MKMLNLDKLTPHTGRALTINGVQHPIVVMSVEKFVETTKNVQTIAAEGADEMRQIELVIDVILAMVPSLTKEQLHKYDFVTLTKVAEFVRGDNIPEQEEIEGGEGN